MGYPDERGVLVVSLQDRTLGGAPEGHLAAGALVGADRAVFPLSAEARISDEADLHILIAPADPDRVDVIERIAPLQVLIRSLESSPQARTVLVLMAQESRYAVEPPPLSQDRLQEALESTGEIWSALEELRLVPASLRDWDPAEALARIRRAEADRRRRLVHELLGRHPGEIASCPFSNITQCERGGFLRDRR